MGIGSMFRPIVWTILHTCQWVQVTSDSSQTLPVQGLDRNLACDPNRMNEGSPGHTMTFLRMENNAAVYLVGSGTYRFQSALPEDAN